jgi:hypothetical protein
VLKKDSQLMPLIVAPFCGIKECIMLVVLKKNIIVTVDGYPGNTKEKCNNTGSTEEGFLTKEVQTVGKERRGPC